MPGSRFLKIQLPLLTALTLLAACKVPTGVGAEPVRMASTAATSRPAETHVVINIPSRTLWVYDGDRIVRYFPVGVGRVGYMTPLGKFSVIRKVMDPGWENPYLPSGKVRLAPGEDNPLGTRWIGFYQKAGGEYGMHGTDTPESVGKFSSHGCVRLKVPDAEALFDMVDVGTPVDIVYEPVLIRRKGDQVRVVVYADRFNRGMPSVETVKANILKQYPGVRLNMDKLKAALQTPNERPMDVGTLPETEQATVQIPASTAQDSSTQQPGDAAAKLPILQDRPAQVENAPVQQAITSPMEPKIQQQADVPKATAEPLQSPVQEPASEKILPLNPRQFFNSETSRL